MALEVDLRKVWEGDDGRWEGRRETMRQDVIHDKTSHDTGMTSMSTATSTNAMTHCLKKWTQQSKVTYHHLLQLCKGLNKGPNPFMTGLASKAPLPAPTTTPPGPCLGYQTLKKNGPRGGALCFGRPATGRRLLQMSSFQEDLENPLAHSKELEIACPLSTPNQNNESPSSGSPRQSTQTWVSCPLLQ